MSRSSQKRWIVGLLAIGLVLRAGYAFYIYHSPAVAKAVLEYRSFVSDPESYDLMASNILEHGELSVGHGPLTDREPLYPFVLAAAHAVFGHSFVVGLALNLIIGLVSCWLIYLLTYQLFGNFIAAILSLALAAFYPEWIYYGAFLYREPLVTLMLILWAWLWVSREERSSFWTYALLGINFGALSLTRSPFIPIGGVFLILAARHITPKRWPQTLGLFLLCAGLMQVPWIIRNYRVTGRFVAGASMGGSVMYLSLLKDYSRPEVPFEAPFAGNDAVIRMVQASGLTASQAEPIYYHACWTVMRDNPRLFWSAFFHKCVKLWQFYPSAGWDYAHPRFLLIIVGLLSNTPLVFLGLIGLWLAWRKKIEIGFLIIVPAVMTVIFGLFWAATRYHAPLMFAFMPLAAFALTEIFSYSAPAKRKSR